jgi:hypothetical protein
VAYGYRSYNERLVTIMIDHAEANGYSVLAHILEDNPKDPLNGFYSLHNQCFLINMEHWRAAGSPKFGGYETTSAELPLVVRSSGNFHDDYTPLWVKATGKHSMQLIACQGWKLLSAMFDGEYAVITLTEKIRLSKFYTYPDHETTKFAESLRTLTTYPDMNWNQNKWINDSKYVKDQIWLFNSESIRIHNDNGPYDLVVNTASGFKIFDFFKTPRLADNAKCIVYDFNPKSLLP